jgi:SAM-dependent methyltransferase
MVGFLRHISKIPNYRKYILFFNDYKKFNSMLKAASMKPLSWKDRLIILGENTEKTKFDTHYVYHPAWAARIIAKTQPEYHVDISSTLHFCSMLSTFIPVRFFDFRPANIKLSGLTSAKENLTSLSFPDASIDSLSCMHTIEHLGLGRYGDPLDPKADLTASEELKRVLAKDGNLYIVTPVGKPKIAFNAHRIYSYEQVLKMFEGLKLKEFSLIPDNALDTGILENADPKLVEDQKYGCGCFWFTK